MKKKKYVILGDSISEGIGKKKISYLPFLQEKFNEKITFVNLAHTGTTIDYANSIYNEIKKEKPDFALIMYGNVDAQIRAHIWGNKYSIHKFIPNRYTKNGMLDPRPFYSKKLYRYIPDRIDNILRFVFKKVVILFEGKTQWLKIDDFKKEYVKLITEMKKDNIQPILISTVYLDDKYFLDSNKEYEKYNKCIQELSIEYKCKYVNIYDKLKQEVLNSKTYDKLYSKDHFHPNINGYNFIGEIISKSILE